MLAIFTWVCSLLGFALTYVVLLGNAMCTVPIRLKLWLAVLLSVLPAIGLSLGYVGASRAFADEAVVRALSIYALPMLFALGSIVVLVLELSENWMRRRHRPPAFAQTYVADGSMPAKQLEIRLAYDLPSAEGPPATELVGTSYSRQREPLYLSRAILISNSDLQESWVRGPIADGSFELGLGFSEAAMTRLSSLPEAALGPGQRWAVMIDGVIIAAPHMLGGVARQMSISAVFDRIDAQRIARALMRPD